eukprot:2892433-Amphidinium_carterae.1
MTLSQGNQEAIQLKNPPLHHDGALQESIWRLDPVTGDVSMRGRERERCASTSFYIEAPMDRLQPSGQAPQHCSVRCCHRFLL